MSPLPRAPMRRDANRNHEALLTATIEVLAASPEASMGDIAAASGMGRTTLYRHFPDRTALLDAVRSRVVADAEEITGRTLASTGGDPVEVVADLSVELAGLGDRYRFLTGQAGDYPEKPREGDPLLTFLEAAQRGGGVRRDCEVSWLFDAVVALITVAAKDPDPSGDRRRQLRITVADVLRP